MYIATELTPADLDGRLGPDEDERLVLEWRPWQDAVSLAETGGIRDAKSISGAVLAGARDGGRGPALAEGFASGLRRRAEACEGIAV